MATIDIRFKDPKTEDTSAFFDNEWVKSTFIISDKDLSAGGTSPYEEWIKKNRYSTSADHKFSCTSPGMSLGVNPKPQFTRYADIRSKGRLPDRPDVTVGAVSSPTGLGMGGYYSMAFDDNQQRIYLRFGVPSYMFLPIWIMKAFDIHKTVLQSRGTITSSFLQLVDVGSKFFAFAANPLLWGTMFAVKAIVANSRFYSLKPTMYTYWATVENILNALVARRTMLPYLLKDYTYKLDKTVGNEEKISEEFVNDLSSFIPDIVDPTTGRISVFGIALRSQAAFNSIKIEEIRQREKKISEAEMNSLDHGGSANSEPLMRVTRNLPTANASNPQGGFINKLFKTAHGVLMANNPDENVEGLDENNATTKNVISYDEIYRDENGNMIDVSLDKNNPNDGIDARIQSNVNKKADKLLKYGEYLLAELTEGAAFAVFNVEATGSVNESFSSSFGANPIESTFNAISAKARNIGSLLSGIGDVPVVGDAMKLAADAGATILSNASYGFANPLLALAYGVNVSMPKVWESSSASLPSSTYKMRLISPYGNAYSQLFAIYLPLSMILAGSLPRATGASTYTSPFFCQHFDRGRNNTSLAMISNVTVTRGTSNLAFTRAGHPNAIDIDFSITSLDEIVSVDVVSSGILTQGLQALDPDVSDTPFITYLNTVAAVDVYTQAFRVPMLRLKLAERMMKIKSITSPDPAAFAAMTVENIPFGAGRLARDILGDPQATLQALNTY